MPDLIQITPEQQARIDAALSNAPAALKPLVAVYAPALLRITLANANADLSALINKLAGLTTPEALDEIYQNMTREELEREKAVMTNEIIAATQRSYESKQVWRDILKAVLSLGVSCALAACGF